ncbi:UPF0481 protein At3g47200 [Eucalyptus grandis]|uniref:UPF0481 protein At3g47200 n=1 Tax=Eucalyptus grandis TaxID=71139 RepID=UPI00192ECBBE|nr:UPF0481 protein At3g47200 [Eucalyptus grandis]
MPPPGPNETDWIVQVNESLDLELPPSGQQQYWGKRSIYKVRSCIADLNRKAYQPQVVSFGPFHHGEEHLLPMEEHKRRALCRFLKRSGKRLEPFLDSLREVAQVLEESYDALDPTWKVGSSEGAADQFLKVMITDGCFMLEILRSETQVDGYAVNDPIFSDHGRLHIWPYIVRDMLMLENQLPLLVLDRLVTVEGGGEKGDEFINGLILDFCNPSGTLSNNIGKCLHVLDVYRKSLLFPKEKPEKKVKSNEVPPELCGETTWSATKLHEHGIRLRKSGTSGLEDVSFDSGVLRLPSIEVDDATESAFLNLIAFEHFHVGAGNEVTSYICLMDNIIDKGQDVTLLQAKGIIENHMESDEAAAKLFNSLANCVMLDGNSSLRDVINRVREYCKKRRHKWRANLIHTYFRNPWVILSLIAAVLLFALTIIQTVYSALSDNK